MNVTVTFRHVDPTPALRQHAEEKIRRLNKYLHRPVDAHVILSVVKERHTAEITLNADHESMFAKEVTHDLYSAIDLAVGKLEHQAQRLKEKREDHKGHNRAAGPGVAPTATVRDERIVAGERAVGPLSTTEAMARLEHSEDDFLAFLDADTKTMAVLYRRKDGRYGLIES